MPRQDRRPPHPEAPPPVQRIRLTFRRTEAQQWLSHLDTMRMLERAFRRGNVPVAYSSGFTPHARVSVAAPLAVGTLSEGELVEVFLAERRDLTELSRTIGEQVPGGFDLAEVAEIPLDAPPVQTLTVACQYRIDLLRDPGIPDLGAAIQAILDRPEVEVMREREDERIYFDLKRVLRAAESPAPGIIQAEFRHDNEAGGRAEDLLFALGISPLDCRITRTRIVLTHSPVKPGNPVPRRIEKLPRGQSDRDRILRYPETAQ